MGTYKRSALVYMILAIFLIFTGCSKKNGNGEDKKEEEKTRIPIEVATVDVGDIAAYFNGTATLEAEEDAQWWEEVEKEAEKAGFWIESGEGDPCDIFAVCEA